MTELFGPSLFWDARGFHERFGSDEALLARQEELLNKADD